MLDYHLVPYGDWGIRPALFYIGNSAIPSYSFFIILALIVGCFAYYLEARKQKSMNENTFYILIAAIVGGALGAKIPIVFIYWKEIVSSFPDLSVLLSGRTILGGLIGGMIGVLYIKKRLGIKGRKGNLFAPAIALGVAIGRIGCFLRGCCFGKPTLLPWGVDFGDGILRHPTEIYESLFMLSMFFYLMWKKDKKPKPGSLFSTLMVSYFIFRFFIEFIREEKVVFLGMTVWQIICLLGLVYFFIKEKGLRSIKKGIFLYK